MGLFDIDNITKKVSELTGKADFSIQDILNDEFIQKNTQFQTLNDFLEKSGLDISNLKNIDSIPTESLNAFIKNNSNFNSWKEFLQEAMKNGLNK